MKKNLFLIFLFISSVHWGKATILQSSDSSKIKWGITLHASRSLLQQAFQDNAGLGSPTTWNIYYDPTYYPSFFTGFFVNIPFNSQSSWFFSPEINFGFHKYHIHYE